MSKFIKNALLAILAVIVSVSLVSCADKGDTPQGMKLASNPEADYQMFVPNEWITDMSAGAVSAYVSLSDPSSVSVMAFNIDENLVSIDDWWASYKEEFDLVFDNYSLETEENGTFGGVAAKKYTYTASLGQTNYKIMQAGTVEHGMIYLFTYTSVPEMFDSHLEEIAKILDNFRFN